VTAARDVGLSHNTDNGVKFPLRCDAEKRNGLLKQTASVKVHRAF